MCVDLFYFNNKKLYAECSYRKRLVKKKYDDELL